MLLCHINLHVTTEALQIGSRASVFLFGIITFQAYVYYTSFRDDRWSLNALVRLIYLVTGYKLSSTKVTIVWYVRALPFSS